MLSRLALQRAATVAWKPQLALACRSCSSSMGHRAPTTEVRNKKETIERWDHYNKIFYGKDRDLKNYPHPVQPEHPPPTRLGFLPDSLFQAFYNKTGVTGPYVLLFSVGTFLISKELIVVEHNFGELMFMLGGIFLTTRFVGKMAKDASDKHVHGLMEKYWYEPIHEAIDECNVDVKKYTEKITALDANKYIYETQRENVDFQLESAYRKRLAEVHAAVKKRLDYQVAKQTASQQFEQKHMVNWIISNVRKSITPQQEKDTLARCIQDLTALSATAKV